MAGTTTYYGISYPTSTDYVKDGASAIQTVATGFDSAVAIPTYNAQTGATYTFALTDVGKTVTASNASAQTYTIPPTASVAWTASTTLRVLNLGAGVVTFAAGAGVTVTNTAQTLAQYQSARLVRTGLNAWTITPDSGPAAGLTLLNTTTVGTAVTSVTVSNVFSATYQNYKILISNVDGSTDDSFISIKFNNSASTTYAFSNTIITLPASSAASGSSSTANGISVGLTGLTNNTASQIEVLNPFNAFYTTTTQMFTGTTQLGFGCGIDKNSASQTGFSINYIGAGNLTGGTISTYGYQL